MSTLVFGKADPKDYMEPVCECSHDRREHYDGQGHSPDPTTAARSCRRTGSQADDDQPCCRAGGRFVSTTPERHVPDRLTWTQSNPQRCRVCRVWWPCDAITEHRERVAEAKRADEMERQYIAAFKGLDAAEQDDARLAKALRDAHEIAHRCCGTTCPDDCQSREALRLHDERVKGDAKPHHYSPDAQAMGDCRVCGWDRDRHDERVKGGTT